MLLIWLLLPAVGAIIDCKSACELCQLDKDPATIYITCTLCRKCHWALNPRRMMELQLPGRNKLLVEGQLLDEDQQNELKEEELKAFKDVLKDYGWQPEDLVTSIKDLDEPCIPVPDNCLREWEGDEQPHHLKGKKTKCHITTCPPTPKTTKRCPPIKPCKKKHTSETADKPPPSEDTQISTTSMSTGAASLRRLRKRFLRQLVANLDETQAQSDGCPPQPDCSDEESEENMDEAVDKLVNKKNFTPPPLTFATSTTERPCLDRTTVSCVPCMPRCPLPCIPQMPFQIPVPIPVPAPIGFPLGQPALLPSQIIEALMTIKTTTDITTTTEKEKEDELIEKKVKGKKAKEKNQKKETVSESSAESSELMVLEKKKTTKTATEDDFLYLYVGVPKDIKNVRRG